ncbi:MAG: hypothetical protein R3C53_18595 [Pirellulaceae bacterium]
MMDEPTPAPWIYIGECPVCVNGLCRVRYCEDDQGHAHLYAMCDECEAIWLQPTTDSEKLFAGAEEPLCPLCSRALYGPQSHWARPDEVVQTEWAAAAIFDIPSAGPTLEQPPGTPLSQDGSSIVGSDDGFITVDDVAAALDAPPPPEQRHSSTVDDLAGDSDAAYGQDEPKPGC